MSKVSKIRDEIWELVQNAPSMTVVHWYVALDDCFENDFLFEEDVKDMKWRLLVLKDLKEPVTQLTVFIDDVLTPEMKKILMEKSV